MKSIIKKGIAFTLTVLMSVSMVGNALPGSSQMASVQAEEATYVAAINGTGGEMRAYIASKKDTVYEVTFDYYLKSDVEGTNAVVSFYPLNDKSQPNASVTIGDADVNQKKSATITYNTGTQGWLRLSIKNNTASAMFYVWNIVVKEAGTKIDPNSSNGNYDFKKQNGNWWNWDFEQYKSNTHLTVADDLNAATLQTGHKILPYSESLFVDMTTWSFQPVLAEAIDLHYKVKVNVALDAGSVPEMEFVLSNGTEVVRTEKVKGVLENDGRYNFDFELLPQQMAYEITATLSIVTEGNTKTQTKTYSMKEYCVSLLRSDDSSVYMGNLVADLLRYGGQTQIMFGKKDDITSGLSLNGYGKNGTIANLSEYVVEVLSGEQTNSSYKWKSASLVLSGIVTIRFKFAASDITNLKVKVSGTEYPIQEDKTGGFYYVDVPMIATDFDKIVKANFYVGDTQEPTGATLSYSVNTYLYRKQHAESQKQLLQALFNYGQSAEIYYAFINSEVVLDNDYEDNWEL